MATATLSYSEDLTGSFDIIYKKAESGLATCRQIHNFFKKRAKAEEEYLKGLEKSISKLYSFDERGTLGEGFAAMLEYARKESSAFRKRVEELNKITVNLGALTKDMENKTKQTTALSWSLYAGVLQESISPTTHQEGERLISEGTKYSTDLRKDAIEPLKKAQEKYVKSRLELDNEMNAVVPSGEADTAKTAKRITRAEAEALSCEEEYKIAIGVANELQNMYHTERAPKVLNEFERLEKSRVHLSKANLLNFTTAITDPLPLEAEIHTLKSRITTIDHTLDLQNFIRDNKKPKLPPPQYQFDPVVTPSRPVNKEPNSVKTGKPKPKEVLNSKTVIFGISLEDVMAKQRDTHPNLEIPRIQMFLQDAILQLGGHTTEGIFRVPGSSSEVEDLKRSIDGGNYTLATGREMIDVRTIASVLKLWIPMKSPETAQAEVMSKLPPLNQKVLTSLVNFLQVFCTPEFVAQSKMGINNLSMVFAPAILRCPHDDMVAFQNVVSEMKFVEILIAELPPDTTLFAHLPKDTFAPPVTTANTRPNTELLSPTTSSDAPPSSSTSDSATASIPPVGGLPSSELSSSPPSSTSTQPQATGWSRPGGWRESVTPNARGREGWKMTLRPSSHQDGIPRNDTAATPVVQLEKR